MKVVSSYSGGICSWYATKLAIEMCGKENVTCLFADTKFEHEDLYRFLRETIEDFGVRLVTVADGRDPWQVFFDARYLGNSRIDPCSKILKRELLEKWQAENMQRGDTLVLGMSSDEQNRFQNYCDRTLKAGRVWSVVAPAMQGNVSKLDMLAALRERGIDPPELYEMGFPHNNCGGFCVKAGMAHFRLLLQKRREFYLYNERREQELREYLGKDVAILRDRSGGKARPLTLKVFRERIEKGEITQCSDWGGCGCAVD